MNAKFELHRDDGGRPVTAEDPTEAADFVPPASALVAHIQGAMEHQKAALARELHDELGGLLVGAVMDLAWAEQHLPDAADDIRQKLTRARQTVAAAIDLKRRLIEELRPTLLDNVGLFAALRWHVQAACNRAGLECVIDLPDEERRFLPNIPIALFRIAQEALAVLVTRDCPAGAHFSVTIDRHALLMQVRCGGTDSGPDVDPQSLAAIEQRVACLGGKFTYVRLPARQSIITARFSPRSTLAPA